MVGGIILTLLLMTIIYAMYRMGVGTGADMKFLLSELKSFISMSKSIRSINALSMILTFVIIILFVVSNSAFKVVAHAFGGQASSEMPISYLFLACLACFIFSSLLCVKICSDSNRD